MIETCSISSHLAGIIPVAGPPLDYNMPWHDCLMPVHNDYYAIERAVHTAAKAGCNTIWVVLHKETQRLIKHKLGEWVYDPRTVWVPPETFWNKREIPVYYVCVNAKDRNRRDSLAWSILYGAKAATYTSKKISKWVIPKKFFVVSPYGVVNEEIIDNSRELLREEKNILFTNNNKCILDNEHLPFTFDQEVYEKCRLHFRDIYSGHDTQLSFNDVFSGINQSEFNKIDIDWYYKLTNWEEYSKFVGSEHNKECVKPKYMVTHKWWGLVKDK